MKEHQKVALGLGALMLVSIFVRPEAWDPVAAVIGGVFLTAWFMSRAG